MKFSISSSELLKGLMEVSKAIPSKSSLPILENFLFSLKEDKLEITASDSDLTLRTSLTVDSTQEEGCVAVPAKHVTDLLKALPDQPIGISTNESSSTFECTWSNGNSSLPFFPGEDYPQINGVSDSATKITVPADTLIDGINGTIYATADDEMRPAMNGIFFDIDIESSTLVASDSHKLICYTTPEIKAQEKSSFILHKKAASVLKSILGRDGGEIVLAFDENNVNISFGESIMICRLVIGKFPRYREVIPQNNSNLLRIDRSQLLNVIKRISVCANKASNHIKFDLKQGQVEVSAQDLGFAIAAYEKVPCNYNGDDLTIGFKSSFLIDILSNMTCDNLVMKFADARRAALIVPSEEEEESENMCGIIMPIMV